MSRRALVSLALLAGVGSLACGILARVDQDRQRAGADGLALGLERLLHERDTALVTRAAELAALPRLAPALATDAETVRDLTADELSFRPRAGETITIAQQFRDGRVVVLLSIPEGAAATPSATGARVAVRGSDLVLSRTIAIVPSERADEISGLLGVSRTIDGRDLASLLPTIAAGARLEIGKNTLAIGGPPARGFQGAAEHRIPLPDGAQAKLLLAADGPTRALPLWSMSGLLALLSIASVWRAARPRAAAAARSSAGSGVPAADSVVPASGSSAREIIAMAATVASPLAPQPAEQRIGRYAIIRRLGQGGMADVFLARAEGEAGFGKLVAFKVLQPFFAAQSAAVDLFLDEARLVAGLDHPNIVQTHDLGRAGDRYFIAMEYVDGTDLAFMLEVLRQRGERVPISLALAILCRICDGLHAAHTATGPDGRLLHLVHRDVKSANVFLARTGAVKVGDFGIAKARHNLRVSRTEIGQVKGTPGYMPPEQRLGMEVDLRADIYGVGAIAYEMLSGEAVNLDYIELAAHGTAGWPHLPRLTSLRTDVPDEVDAVIFKALAYAREERFPDCAALEQALRTAGARCGIGSDKDIGMWVKSELERRPSTERVGA